MYNTNILREASYLIPQTIYEQCIRGVKIPVFCFPAGILGKPSKLTLNRDGDIGALPAGYSRLSQDAPVSPSLLSAEVLMGAGMPDDLRDPAKQPLPDYAVRHTSSLIDSSSLEAPSTFEVNSVGGAGLNGTIVAGAGGIGGNSTSASNAGVAEFSSDIKLTRSVNTRQVITKKFKATDSITASQVVVIDPPQDGYVTTTASMGDTKIIGVAVQTVANAGDDIEVAIGGSIQVQFDPETLVTPGDLINSVTTQGNATNSSPPANGSVLGKATSVKDVGNLAWILMLLE